MIMKSISHRYLPPACQSLPLRALFALTACTALAACGGGGDDSPAGVVASAGAARAADGARTPTLPPQRIDSGQETVTCTNGSIGALSLDTVFVPDGAACELFGTRLRGSILVGSRASALAVDVAVNGNLQAEGSADIVVEGASSFGGSVQIKQGGGATVRDARITGDLQFDAMVAPLLADGNVIGGSLQAVGNRGGVALSLNRMNGNLQCKENDPAPTGGGNRATSKEDQCAAL
jgi:hypothetical protein